MPREALMVGLDPHYSQGMAKRPPLGLRPQWLILEERAEKIRRALALYDEQALLVPDEWLTELKEIENKLPELKADALADCVKPALAVGQRWRRSDGEVKTILKHHTSDNTFMSQGGTWYHADGTHLHGMRRFDLIELVAEAPAEPASGQSVQEIPELIRIGAAPLYVLIVSDDSGGRCDGSPIIFETAIPAGSSLQAVLKQRGRVGSRYGTTYVAECRIIPELTAEVQSVEVPF